MSGSAEKSGIIDQSEKSENKETNKLAEPSTTTAPPTLQSETQRLIQEYLPAEKQDDPRLANVERLLAKISLSTQPVLKTQTENQVAEKKTVETAVETEIKSEVKTDVKTVARTTSEEARLVEQQQQAKEQVAQANFSHRELQRSKDILPEVFQTLIFQVGKLPLSVPLLKLGGIVKLDQDDISDLVGTPDWFMGLLPHERGNLMVIDTLKYLTPEQQSSTPAEPFNYLIILDNSNWALACHSVGDAKNLTRDDVRWSERSSKRPWFAGMVVEFMSALLEVDELINMLADSVSD